VKELVSHTRTCLISALIFYYPFDLVGILCSLLILVYYTIDQWTINRLPAIHEGPKSDNICPRIILHSERRGPYSGCNFITRRSYVLVLSGRPITPLATYAIWRTIPQEASRSFSAHHRYPPRSVLRTWYICTLCVSSNQPQGQPASGLLWDTIQVYHCPCFWPVG